MLAFALPSPAPRTITVQPERPSFSPSPWNVTAIFGGDPLGVTVSRVRRNASSPSVSLLCSHPRFEGASFGKPGRTVYLRHATAPSLPSPASALFCTSKCPAATARSDVPFDVNSRFTTRFQWLSGDGGTRSTGGDGGSTSVVI